LTEQPSGFWVRVATLGPVGAFPVAPGTLGAAAGAALVGVLHRLPFSPRGLGGILAGAAAAIYLVGVISAGKAEAALGVTDPSPVVIDEVAGQILAFVFQPVISWKSLIGGFLLFRFFDVLKPFPARRLEHLPRGWGIMTDDVMAGAYTALTTFLLGFAVR
jgi:phosphatidylglycerophosphatase A